jgi:hypothetical protein
MSGHAPRLPKCGSDDLDIGNSTQTMGKNSQLIVAPP